MFITRRDANQFAESVARLAARIGREMKRQNTDITELQARLDALERDKRH